MKKLIGLTVEVRDILKVPLENTQVRSADTIAELRQIDKICDAIDAAGEELELEDADFLYLKGKFTSFNWNPRARKQVLSVFELLA